MTDLDLYFKNKSSYSLRQQKKIAAISHSQTYLLNRKNSVSRRPWLELLNPTSHSLTYSLRKTRGSRMTPFSTLYSLTSLWIPIISLTLSKCSKSYLPSPTTTYGISFSYDFFETKHEFINFYLLQKIQVFNIKWFFFLNVLFLLLLLYYIIQHCNTHFLFFI